MKTAHLLHECVKKKAIGAKNTVHCPPKSLAFLLHEDFGEEQYMQYLFLTAFGSRAAVPVISLIVAALSFTGESRADGHVAHETTLDTAEISKTKKSNAVDLKIRFLHPFSESGLYFGFDGKVGIGTTNLGGGSIGIDIKRFVAIEGGTKTFFAIAGTAFDINARGGVMPVVAQGGGSDYRGSVLQLGGLAGYHFLFLEHKYEGVTKIHAVSLAAALDYTYWYARFFGLTFRLLIEVPIPVAMIKSPDAYDSGGQGGVTLGFIWSSGLAF